MQVGRLGAPNQDEIVVVGVVGAAKIYGARSLGHDLQSCNFGVKALHCSHIRGLQDRMGNAPRFQRGCGMATQYGIGLVPAFLETLGGQRIPLTGDQIHLAAQYAAPRSNRIAIELVVVSLRIEDVDAVSDLMIDGHVDLEIGGFEPAVTGDQLRFILQFPRQMIQAGLQAHGSRQLQQSIPAVTVDAVGLLNHSEVVLRMSCSQERRNQVGFGELDGQAANVVVERFRFREIVDPEVYMGQPSRVETGL